MTATLTNTVLTSSELTDTVLTTDTLTDAALAVEFEQSAPVVTAPAAARLSPAQRAARMAHALTFHLPALVVLASLLGKLPQDEEEVEREEGFSVAEWVIGVAIIAGLALAVGALIVDKVTQKANTIDLG